MHINEDSLFGIDLVCVACGCLGCKVVLLPQVCVLYLRGAEEVDQFWPVLCDLEVQKGEAQWLLSVCCHVAGRDGFLEFRFSAQQFYLPFRWNGWTITKHILMHQQNNMVYNHQQRWHIGNRWATPDQQWDKMYSIFMDCCLATQERQDYQN